MRVITNSATLVLGILGLAAVSFLSCTKAESVQTVQALPAVATGQSLDGAIAGYRTWVLAEADAFLEETRSFVGYVGKGDRESAKSAYPRVRMHFERIEPIAEALGDFDPRIDAREGDVAEADWRGFHRIEKVLWSKDDLGAAVPYAQTLLEDVQLLRAQIESAVITPEALVNGAVELLNEVSTSKVTGEEERYSHTDLWDFQANVEGAHKIHQILGAVTGLEDPALARKLDQEFTALFDALAAHKVGDDFADYTTLGKDEVARLSELVDVLAESLAQLARVFAKA